MVGHEYQNTNDGGHEAEIKAIDAKIVELLNERYTHVLAANAIRRSAASHDYYASSSTSEGVSEMADGPMTSSELTELFMRITELATRAKFREDSDVATNTTQMTPVNLRRRGW